MEGDYQASIATLDRAIELWRRLDDPAGEADALRARGGTVMFQGDLDSAEVDMTQALELFRRVGDRRGEAWAVQNLATIAFFRGDPDLADRRLAAAADMFRELDDWGGLNWTFAVLAWVRFMQGRLEDAEVLAHEQLPESEATGNRWVSGILDMLLGSISLWSGRAGQAVDYARKAVAQFHGLGDPWGENQARSILVRALAVAGRVDEALTTVDAALDGPRQTVEGRKISALVRAQVLVHCGDADALAAALHASRPDDRWTLSHEYRMVLSTALVQAGRTGEAIAELEDARTTIAEDAGPGSANNAALAIAYAVAGHTAEARKAADNGIDRGTYLDQHQCAVAGAVRASPGRRTRRDRRVRRRGRAHRPDRGPARPGRRPGGAGACARRRSGIPTPKRPGATPMRARRTRDRDAGVGACLRPRGGRRRGPGGGRPLVGESARGLFARWTAIFPVQRAKNGGVGSDAVLRYPRGWNGERGAGALCGGASGWR